MVYRWFCVRFSYGSDWIKSYFYPFGSDCGAYIELAEEFSGTLERRDALSGIDIRFVLWRR